jgi:hypothetical protein
MHAPYLLIHGGIRVYRKGENELLGFAYAQELPGGDGQIQRWLLRDAPGEYEFKPWDNGPQDLEQWLAMVAKEPPLALWGMNPTLDGIWASGAFYIMAQSTVVHYTEGMDTSTLALIEPKYPFVPDSFTVSAGERAQRSPGTKAIAGSTSTRAPRPPAGPSHGVPHDKAGPLRRDRQLVVGDKVIVQSDPAGYCFGHTDIEELAKTKSQFTADEYWLLKTGYQSAGVEDVTTVIRDPVQAEEQFESLALFKTFVKDNFGTTYSSYEVTGCNYYQGEDPPAHL